MRGKKVLQIVISSHRLRAAIFSHGQIHWFLIYGKALRHILKYYVSTLTLILKGGLVVRAATTLV